MNLNAIKKKKIDKKWNTMIKQQQQLSENKTFTPGILKFNPINNCQSRLVNFFGNVHSQVFSLKVSNNDKYVGAACSNGQVRIYDIYQGDLIFNGNTSHLTCFPCTSFKWKPKHEKQFITSNCDGTVRWFDLGQQLSIGSHQNDNHGYLCCQYQYEQQWVACGTDKGDIQIFDNQTMKLIQAYNPNLTNKAENESNRIFSIKCLREDKNIFFSGGWDSSIEIYDIRVNKISQRRFYGPSISADSLDYRNGTILVGNYKNNDILQLWDFKSGQLIETIDINQPKNGSSYCFGAVFGHKSEKDLIGIALTGSNKVKIFKDKQITTEIVFQASPFTLDFHRFQNKDFLVAAGMEGTIYVIRLQWKNQQK